jgi:hypothetical protein
MGQGIVAALLLKFPDQVLHDLVVLGVETDPEPRGGDLAQPIEHHPVVGRRDVADRLAEEALEADHAGVGHRLEGGDAVLDQQADDAEVDEGLLLRESSLELDVLGRVRLGLRVGHLDDGRHSAVDRRGGPRPPVLLVLEARLPEVDVTVDHTRQDVQPRRVELLGR